MFENANDHVWWFSFDDINNRIIASRRNLLVEPFMTVSTGKTLKENNLEIVEKIADISSKLIVNRVSLKTQSDDLNTIVKFFERKNND